MSEETRDTQRSLREMEQSSATAAGVRYQEEAAKQVGSTSPKVRPALEQTVASRHPQERWFASWFGGSNYALGGDEDVEVFPSLAAAIMAFEDRGKHGYAWRSHFEYINQ